ncbi:hypothetical protein HI914_04665 [Erysiphe necator]|nr:hypothetical protein HI914_04665 [Erysiphe necator]
MRNGKQESEQVLKELESGGIEYQIPPELSGATQDIAFAKLTLKLDNAKFWGFCQCHGEQNQLSLKSFAQSAKKTMTLPSFGLSTNIFFLDTLHT